MAKIPHLFPRQSAAGTCWHWKPSPRLRKAGWTNQNLGTDRRQAIIAAMDLNDKVGAWDTSGRAVLAATPAPRRWTFGDLVDAYRTSDAFLPPALAASTMREYNVRLSQLRLWADDGALPLLSLDAAAVRDLKAGLAEGGASLHKIGAILRVLRLLLAWAVDQDIIDSNPATKVKIRTAPARTVIIAPEHALLAAGRATAMQLPGVGMAIEMGLWTLQREADLLGLNRMSWREMENCAPYDRTVLAGSGGKVMGFRLRQGKTGAWIDAPVPPHMHPAIEAAFARSQWLLADDADPGRAYPQHLLQRRVRDVFNAEGLAHAQFRDLRRSGMCMMKDLGCDDSGITSISGHMVLGHRSILDTYMPTNTRTACATLATAVRALAQRQPKEEAQ